MATVFAHMYDIILVFKVGITVSGTCRARSSVVVMGKRKRATKRRVASMKVSFEYVPRLWH